MEGALDFHKLGSLEGKTIAIQGAGNVAVSIIEELLERNVAHIYVTDCHQKRVDDVKDMFSMKVSIKSCVLFKYCDKGSHSSLEVWKKSGIQSWSL